MVGTPIHRERGEHGGRKMAGPSRDPMPQEGLTGGREALTPRITSDQKLGGIPNE